MPIEPVGPVLVGVDGSAASLAALDLAADEAAGRVTPLVVYAFPADDRAAVVPSCAPEWVDRPTARRRLLGTLVGRVVAEHPGLAVRGELVAGDPADALIADSTEACLVVVGIGGGPSALAGPLALRVASHAAAPVLVHRPLEVPAAVEFPRPVLVGLDGLAAPDALVGFAFAEAAVRGAPLAAMYVWSRPPGAEPAGLHPPGYGYADARDEAERMLAEVLAGWSDKHPDVPVHRAVRHSMDVVGTLRDASAGAQLVVVGRSRRSALAGMLLGSVSRALVQRAGCPVAIVP